jgi:hypothetical protein
MPKVDLIQTVHEMQTRATLTWVFLCSEVQGGPKAWTKSKKRYGVNKFKGTVRGR